MNRSRTLPGPRRGDWWNATTVPCDRIGRQYIRIFYLYEASTSRLSLRRFLSSRWKLNHKRRDRRGFQDSKKAMVFVTRFPKRALECRAYECLRGRPRGMSADTITCGFLQQLTEIGNRLKIRARQDNVMMRMFLHVFKGRRRRQIRRHHERRGQP